MDNDPNYLEGYSQYTYKNHIRNSTCLLLGLTSIWLRTRKSNLY